MASNLPSRVWAPVIEGSFFPPLILPRPSCIVPGGPPCQGFIAPWQQSELNQLGSRDPAVGVDLSHQLATGTRKYRFSAPRY